MRTPCTCTSSKCIPNRGFVCAKGPVKLIERVKIAHSFLVCVKSVPGYHCKLAYLILQIKNFSKPNSKNGEIGRFNRFLLKESF